MRLPFLLVISLVAVSSAAAQPSVQTSVADRIRAGTGAKARIETPADTPGRPPSVDTSDGISGDEAVALALWNNAAFQVAVSQLGFARADLADAGLLANPVLSLLFPLGPKQLEATLRWPAEILWERPRRVAAAELSLEVAASTLVQSGLDVALSVRLAHTDLALTRDRQRLASETAAALRRIDELTQSRLAAGDIGALDARVARIDAQRSLQDAERAVHDVRVARERLALLTGLTVGDSALDTVQPTVEPTSCGFPQDLLARALAARPDLRAAQLAIEAAGARLGWERSRVLTLAAVLDANGRGISGFEAGPGVDISLPIFNRNQGGKLRALTELQRASAAYVALQQQVGLDVREASTLFEQARQSREAWRTTLVAPLEANLADAEDSFRAGETSFLFVLENSRRLIEARLREREIAADEQRAMARIERAVGARCSAPGGPQ